MKETTGTGVRSAVRQILELVRTGQLSPVSAVPVLRALDEKVAHPLVPSPVAVIGVGGAFPGGATIPEFWQSLREGRDSVQEIPPNRWDWRSVYSTNASAGRSTSKWGGFLRDAEMFDPIFFQISPREALQMDPQQRLFLQAAWHALEDGGHADPVRRLKCSIFAGCRDGDYRNLLGIDRLDSYSAIGCDAAILSARLAYFLDFSGPAITVDTACSSSLAAIALACTALQAGDCDVALAGGVSVLCTPQLHISLSQTGMLSPTGRCRAFDSAADGFVPAEGAGVVLLKPLAAALADGDSIYAVIEGWGLNQDGTTNGITAPSGPAQAALLREVYERFSIPVDTIGYIETHGTGTQLGDPIELQALAAVYGEHTKKERTCALGSVKTNIGHALAAAGIAGFLRAVGSLHHAELWPSLHWRHGNPNFDLSQTPFWVNTSLQSWQSSSGHPRRAAVSSFGFSGTNVHLVLREADPHGPRSVGQGLRLFPLSARTERALAERIHLLAEWVSTNRPNLDDLSFTLLSGRRDFELRKVVAAGTTAELAQRLKSGEVGELPDEAVQWLAGGNGTLTELGTGLLRAGARRISAPLYPFEKTRYWPIEPNSSAAATLRPPIHLALTGQEPWLKDHVVRGRPTAPGVLTLCLVSRTLPLRTCLRDVTWTKPFEWTSNSRALSIVWNKGSKDADEFSLTSDGVVHSTGRTGTIDLANSETVDLGNLRKRLGDPLSAVQVYERFRELGFDYGGSLRGIVEVYGSETEALAFLRAPDIGSRDTLVCQVALLDAALQALQGVRSDRGPTWPPVPFALDACSLPPPETTSCWAWLRITGSGDGWLRFDVDLIDPDGITLGWMRGLTVRPLAGSDKQPSRPLETLLIELLAEQTGLAPQEISPQENFSRYGIDSMMAINMTRHLEERFGELPKTLFFEFSTLASLAAHLNSQVPLPSLNSERADTARPEKPEQIAIVGISGRFPDASNLDEFWANLRTGRDSIREIPPARWDHEKYFDPRRGIPGKTWARWGGFLEDIDRFDPLLFRISPREAEIMDPQERLFLESAWETVENAGYQPKELAGKAIGVWAGAMYTHYQLFGAEAGVIGTPLALNSSQSALANRVSYFFDWHGPSIGLDTMCSSSLTAIHLACDAIRNGEVEAALAGGVNLTLHPQKYLLLSQANVASSDGRCRSFGAGGDGYVPGEGVGTVLLKSLSRAIEDGDTIHAVIRGSALNHGGRTNGFTIPSVSAQAHVVRRCLDRAGVKPVEIGYIEAHGTGTALGDPIELAALGNAFDGSAKDGRKWPIGSVKSNIGHLESAAGMASLAKVILQIQHQEFAPSIHAEELNPSLDLQRNPFVIQRTCQRWDSLGLRVAGISSFGAGGSNAHMVIGEFRSERLASAPGEQILPLSARTPELLRELVRRMARFAAQCAESLEPPRLSDVAYTLQEGRTAFEVRMAICATSFREWESGLLQWLKEGSCRGIDNETVLRWCDQADLNWSTVRPFGRLRRTPLPNTPFLRERCWPAVANNEPRDELVPAVSSDWFRNHRWLGQELLPAAGALQMMCEAAQSSALSEIQWLRPIFGQAGDLRTTVDKDGTVAIRRDRETVALAHRSHSQSPLPRRTVDLNALRGRLRQVPPTQHYEGCRSAGLDYGPEFRVIDQLWVGDKEAIASLVCRSRFRSISLFDAAMIDGGLQAVAAIEGLWSRDRAPLPKSLGTFEVYQEPPDRMVAHARVSQLSPLTFDVDFYTHEGSLCVTFSRLEVQLPGGRSTLSDSEAQSLVYYTSKWVPTSPIRRRLPLRPMLVDSKAMPRTLEDADRLISSWQDTEQSFGASMPLVIRGAQRARDGWDINSLLILTRALLKSRPQHDRLIYFLHESDAQGAQARHAAVSAYARSLYRENRFVVIKVVESLPGDFDSVLQAELGVEDDSHELAYRDGRRYRRVSAPLPVGKNGDLLQYRGIYLITGGRHGIGLTVAAYLASRYSARLALVGRSEPDNTCLRTMEKFKAQGAEVLSLKADITNANDVRAAIDTAIQRFGRLDGIIHSAGVLRDGFLLAKRTEDFATVLAPKVLGTDFLLQCSEEHRVGFVALFSSLASITGNSGQADYAYANAYMDHIASGWQGRTKVVSINWPYWQHGGMTLGTRLEQQMIESTGLRPLADEAGLRAFHDALAADTPQVIVTTGDQSKIRRFLGISSVSGEDRSTEIESIAAQVALAAGKVLKLAPSRIRHDQPLTEYGMESVSAMQIAAELTPVFGPQPETLLFEYPTVESVAKHLQALGEHVKPLPRKEEPRGETRPDAIAIVGIAGRYPLANNLSELWANLASGRDCVVEVPSERWPAGSWYGGRTQRTGQSQGKWGSFIDGADCFDARFFGITPREAELIDPQERLFLEVAWHALEDAALTRASLSSKVVGVFAGAMWSQYQLYGEQALEEGRPLPASSFASIANRLSYFCNFRGPSLTVDTMCSSSLTAIHLAIESLKRHECDVALAGAVNLSLHPHKYVLLSQGHFLSPKGRCRSFSEGADGYVPGEGAGVVVLKRLSDAVADGDPIRAVICSSKLNHGGRSGGYSVPSPQAQTELLSDAWQQAGTGSPITYIEAHGTGTTLGDPLEIAGLREAWKHVGSGQECRIGSIKSNLGHLEAAAGIAGLTKVILQLEHKELLPSLYADTPNERLDFGGLPIRLQMCHEPWLSPSGVLRKAGVSSFGAGGSNAHLVVEERLQPPRLVPADQHCLLTLSALSQTSLRAQAGALADFIEQERPHLNDVSWTLQTGREHWTERVALIVESHADAIRQLRDTATGIAVRQHTGPRTNLELQLDSLARTWVNGGSVDWGNAEGRIEGARRISLPGYLFDRQRYWATSKTPVWEPNPLRAQETPDPTAVRTPLLDLVASVTRLPTDEIDVEANFADLGLDSVLQREIVRDLEKEHGELPSTLLLDYPSVRTLSAYLRDNVRESNPRPVTVQPGRRIDPSSGAIAIIGIHGRYPGGETLDEFWTTLSEGRSQIREIPPDRWHSDRDGANYCRHGAWLEGVDQFDPILFGMTPLEASQVNPEERLLLESAWCSVENAGYSRSSLRGRRIGVFTGATTNTYPHVVAEIWADSGSAAPDSATYAYANRISYVMDWRGPSFHLDTACSSSLVAIHMACESIRRGECEAALAGAVNLYLHPSKFIRMCQGHLLSRDIPSGLFDRNCDGFIPGEGAGTVLLKPLELALQDGDPIHAVIRGSAISHKGRTNGFHAPSPESHRSLIITALTSAAVTPESINHLELQATGSSAGDILELNALREIFPMATVGSLRPIIGHLEAASGLAALTRAVLEFTRQTHTSTLLASQLHAGIDFSNSALRIVVSPEPWPVNINKARRVGIGSYGAGGTDAFLVLEEAPPRKDIPISGNEHLIVLSAPTSRQLGKLCENLVTFVRENPHVSLASLSWTLMVGREDFPERLGFFARSAGDLILALQSASTCRVRNATDSRVVEPTDRRHALELWLQGRRVEWSFLWSKPAPIRVSLPGYSFDRVRCWIVSAEQQRVAKYYDTTVVRDLPIMLTFAPFPEVIPGFHWLGALTDAQNHPDWTDLVRTRQLELRDSALSNVLWQKTQRILDIGCGLGSDLVRILQQRPHLSGTGYTLSPAQAEAARDLARQANVDTRTAIYCEDVSKATLSADYDLIFGFEVTFHISDKTSLFSNLEKHLKSEGRLILIDCVATTVTSMSSPHLGQFTSNDCEWAEQLASHHLRLTRTVDVSGPISNFLHDPDFESHLKELSSSNPLLKGTEGEHRGWHRFGLLLKEGLIRYMILEAVPDSVSKTEDLRTFNLSLLRSPQPYQPLGDSSPLADLVKVASSVLGIPAERLEVDQPFGEYGVNSLVGLRLLERVNRTFGTRLEATTLYSAPTLRALSSRIPATPSLPEHGEQIQRPRRSEPIAVIGMAGRFPAATNVNQFWRNLVRGKDCVSEVPSDRWSWTEHFDADPAVPGRTYSRWAGFVPGATDFDPQFFRINPADAAVMDPQQRLFLETCWTALDDAGYAGDRSKGSRCGVLAGVLESDFGEDLDPAANPATVAQGMLGNSPSVLAARIAYFLDLKGPAISINTACSSSLVAIHLACQSLQAQETDLMVAGGVSLFLNPRPFVSMSKAGMLSPTGRCRTFSHDADGIAVGEATAAIVLKRLADAERDGDIILGVIVGSGTNQDGTTNGLTAPNGDSQRDLARDVLRRSGLRAEQISYIECHGTGTRLGDPIEVQAIREAYDGAHSLSSPCRLGSVKSNVGHTSAAAGVVGLIKVLLAMRYGMLPPTLHVTSLNPLLGVDNATFSVGTECLPWAPNGTRRVAAVNSFGYSGTNAHILIAEYPSGDEAGPYEDDPGPWLVPLSARTPTALRQLAKDLEAELANSLSTDSAREQILGIVAQVLRLPVDEITHDSNLAELGATAHDYSVLAAEISREVRFDVDAAELAQMRSLKELTTRFSATPSSVPLLSEIAATFQCDRSPMRHRAACMASSLPEFCDQLNALARGTPHPGLTTNGQPLQGEPSEWFGSRNWENLSLLWVSGASINWRALHRTAHGRLPRNRARMLPPYPFERRSFNLSKRLGPTEQQLVRSTDINAAAIQAHRVVSDHILPGSFSLVQCAMEATKAYAGSPFLGLDQVAWLAPVRSSNFTIKVGSLEAKSSGLELIDQAGMTCVKARALFGRVTAPLTPRVHAIDDYRRHCIGSMSRQDFYQRFDAIGVRYGEMLQVVSNLWTASSSALSSIETGERREATTQRFIEGAFQTVLGTFSAGEIESFLPFSLESCTWSEALPSQGFVLVTRRSTAVPTFDLLLMDSDGQEVGALNGLCLRVQAPKRSSPDLWIEQYWRPSPIIKSGSAKRIHFIGFDPIQFAVLSAQLRNDESIHNNAEHATHIVLRLSGVLAKDFEVLERLVAASSQHSSQMSILAVVHAGAAEAPQPLHAAFRSWQLECPEIRGKVVECDLQSETWPENVMAECRAPNETDFAVRYSEGGRTVLCLRRAAISGQPGRSIVQGATWLVTGASGGLGKACVEYLADRNVGKLILTGRRALQPAVVNRLNARGVPVEYCKADLQDPDAIARLIEQAHSRLGVIHGWIHVAGTSIAARLNTNPSKAFEEIFAPKVKGTDFLLKALQNDPLERIVFFSSIASVLGDFGQAAYSAANAYLDFIASKNHARAISIRWPICEDGGMTIPRATRDYLRTSFGIEPLSRPVLFEVLDYALAQRFLGPLLLPLVGNVSKLSHLCDLEEAASASKHNQGHQNSSARVIGSEHLEEELLAAVCDLTHLSRREVDMATELREYGLDSIGYTELATRLNSRLGTSITPALFFECANLAAVSRTVEKQLPKPRQHGDAEAAASTYSTARITTPEIAPSRTADAIAIIGMAGRYPGARDPSELWQLLKDGTDSITGFPTDRLTTPHPDGPADGHTPPRGGFLDDVACFDAKFFGISPREAALMDPQQRLFLETVWATIEDAGYAPSSLAGTSTGIFAGVANMDYANLMARDGVPVEAHATTGVSHAMLANRVSYLLDLRGPSEPIDTACSSSLIAVHRAVEAICAGSCDQAIAGGVNVLLSKDLFESFSMAGMLSPSGLCRTFDAKADGYVRGEGVGAVFLKPLQKALSDGDSVLAVILGTAEGHNGRANGLTAPNGAGQLALLKHTYTKFNIDPSTVTYVEAHGTATPIGDPIECNALVECFLTASPSWREARPEHPWCALGSVKSNIGHLETAAGIAGLTKTILALKNRYIPATLNVQTLNPYLRLDQSPFYVCTEGRDWDVSADQVRRASVSSFGFGGANAHLVIEEFPALGSDRSHDTGPWLFVLSAKTSDRLKAASAALAEYVETGLSSEQLRRLAYTLQIGRDAFAYRLAIISSAPSVLAQKLRLHSRDGAAEEVFVGRTYDGADAASVLLEGAEGEEFTRALCRGGKLHQLAQLWVSGVSINWRLLYGDFIPRRISAPTYPFERARHWYVDLLERSSDLSQATKGDSIRPAATNGRTRLQLKQTPNPGRDADPKVDLDLPRLTHSTEVELAIRQELARVLFMSESVIENDKPFVELGLDSILAVELVRYVNRQFGVDLKASKLFDCPTVAKLAHYVASLRGESEFVTTPSPAPLADRSSSHRESIRGRLTLHLLEIRGR